MSPEAVHHRARSLRSSSGSPPDARVLGFSMYIYIYIYNCKLKKCFNPPAAIRIYLCGISFPVCEFMFDFGHFWKLYITNWFRSPRKARHQLKVELQKHTKTSSNVLASLSRVTMWILKIPNTNLLNSRKVLQGHTFASIHGSTKCKQL